MGLNYKRDEREGYVYDPNVKGADTTYWAALVGTLATTGSTPNIKLRFNADRHTSYLQHVYGDFRFLVNVPTTPSAGEAKVWGLRNPGTPTKGSAYFQITGATFQAVSYDNEGNAETTAITWSSWETVETEFRITWENGIIQFMVGGTIVATHSKYVGNIPQAIDIYNVDADNTDVGSITVSNAGVII